MASLLWVNFVFIDCWERHRTRERARCKIAVRYVHRMRRYELKERARRQEETRQRIVDATVALHREVGPARTTIAEVARRAGVGRVTVYNHFPDDVSLLAACSAHFVARHAPPDPGAWAPIADPELRLRTALEQVYGYYRENAAMLGNVTRDAALVPALAEVLATSGAREHAEAMRDALL